jgi:two-component system, LytTR family, sensor kinase
VLVLTRAYDRPLPGGGHGTFVGSIVDGFFGATLVTAMLFVAITLTMRRGSSSWRAHGVAGVSFGLVNFLGKVIIISLIGAPYRMIPPSRMVGAVISGAVIYGVLALLVHAGEYARRFRGSEAVGLRLRTDLADAERQRVEAELRALKAELNPHFLGNALATVSSFVRTDPAAAEHVLDQLGDVLRGAIARIGTQEVTLGEEIDGLASFLAVERARFGDNLALSWDVDEAVRNARVPHMILQPLVETAIKHGLAPRGAGHIIVAGHRAGKRLELSVRDDGVGVQAAEKTPKRWSTGVGLANTRARLQELYGADASLDLISDAGPGTVVRLTLPWREHDDAAGVGVPALSHYVPTA